MIVFFFSLEMIFLIIYNLKKYSRTTSVFNIIIGKLKIINASIIILIICILTSGCTIKEETSKPLTAYAAESLYYGETSKYNIYFNPQQQTIIAENKESLEKINIIRDLLTEEISICGIFVWNEKCYYLERENSEPGLRIYEINLEDFNRKLIYNNIHENKEDFFGVISRNNIEKLIETLSGLDAFFLDNDYIYYFISDGDFIQINRKTGREKVIAIDTMYGGKSYFYNGDVYYFDNQKRLCIFNKKEGKVSQVDSIFTEDFSIEGDTIKYRDVLDNNKLKYYKIRNE